MTTSDNSKRTYVAHDMAILERVDNVAIISINSPPQNLLEPEILTAIMAALQEAVDTGARAALLKTALKNFSAGADLEVLARPRTSVEEGEKKSGGNQFDTRYFLQFMRDLPIPIVASVCWPPRPSARVPRTESRPCAPLGPTCPLSPSTPSSRGPWRPCARSCSMPWGACRCGSSNVLPTTRQPRRCWSPSPVTSTPSPPRLAVKVPREHGSGERPSVVRA